jgi:hypothetical protein
MMFQPAIIASGGHIHGTVVVPGTELVDGVQVFKLAKGNSGLSRLLGFTVNKDTGRVLAKTDIIEQLQKLRDIEYAKYCGPKVEDDLGVEPVQGKLVPRSDMPKLATITAPSFEGIDGLPVKVALDRSNMALKMELSLENIDYLMRVCRYQANMGNIKRVAHKEAVPEVARVGVAEKGVSFVYKGAKKGCFRVRKISKNKKSSAKFFRYYNKGGVVNHNAEELAIQFKVQGTVMID